MLTVLTFVAVMALILALIFLAQYGMVLLLAGLGVAVLALVIDRIWKTSTVAATSQKRALLFGGALCLLGLAMSLMVDQFKRGMDREQQSTQPSAIATGEEDSGHDGEPAGAR